MATVKKCRSRKHRSYTGGCGNPRCPEGLYEKQVIADAIANQDVAAYLAARGLQDKKKVLKKVEHGVAVLRVEDPDSEVGAAWVSAPINRHKIREELKAIDKNVVPSFENLEELHDHAKSLYGNFLNLRLHYEETVYGWKNICVTDMEVDADMRGAGIGYHVRKMLAKHCDEKGIILTGTPSDGGDRSYSTYYRSQVSEAEHHERAIAHKQRLIDYYLRSGYEKNYGFRYASHLDFLTDQPHETNPEWREQYNIAAQRFLMDAGEYIRWPNQIPPASMLAGKKPKQIKEKSSFRILQ